MNVKQTRISCSIPLLDPNAVRRIGPKELPDVESLVNSRTQYLFGYTSIEEQLSKCYLSLGVYDREEDLVGAMSFTGFPNVPAIPPWEWQHWLHNLYHIGDVYPMSTLWLHFCAWDKRYTTLFASAILQNLFRTNEVLEHVMYVCPPGIRRLDFLEDIATRILPDTFVNSAKVQTIYMLKKADFVAQYTIRRAVEEDNDDLVAIIPKVLEDHYGHFYISELLSKEEETRRHIIVAEHKGCAVGVLCLNEEVNYELLNQEFELIPYNGLKKPDVEDEVILTHMPSATNVLVEDVERLPSIVMEKHVNEEESILEEQDNVSEDDYSLLNISSSLIMNYLYEEDHSVDLALIESETSIESHFSAVILNEEYQDHLYSVEKNTDTEGEERNRFAGRSAVEPDSIPNYYGEPNAFTLEICSALEEHETCLYLLFQAAFECFPDRDYMVCSFPCSSHNLYVQKHFARVVSRPRSVFHHELYVLHRNAILGRTSIRVAVPEDRTAVAEMITGMLKPTMVEEQFKEAVEAPGSSAKGYVFLCEDQIVGFAVVSEEQEHEYLELHYAVDAYINLNFSRLGARGALDEFLVSPIFQRHISFFVRELHRMSDFRILFYRLKRYDYVYTHKTLPIINSLANMGPVLPNLLPEYDQKITDEYQLPQSLIKKHHPFSLYLTTPRLMSTPRLEINDRLVIIGAGITTLAFLESLLISRRPTALVTFTNVTVVSPHGIGYFKQPNVIRDMAFVGNGHVDRRYMDTVCLRTYVHVVTGVMTTIERKAKYVGLNDETFLPYDYLFLLCGQQFQKPPERTKVSITKWKGERKNEFPSNVFIINTEADAANAFNALKSMVTSEQTGNIVVFGHYLEACCCLAALMQFGVSGSNLIYVDPTPENGPSNDRHDHLTQFFNNGEVETAVFDAMLAEGITIYQDYNFVEWKMDNGIITSVTFESKYKFIELHLMALFVYYGKGISTRTFRAIAQSGLVFNGHLVIDRDFRTNDPNVFAAGPMTMYSKKYHAEHLMHKYFNGVEIGQELGQAIRRMLIPKEHWDIPGRPYLRRQPLIHYCHFPGNLHYLHVSSPGKAVPLDVAVNTCTYGKVLVTGNCKDLQQQGYFRLHLNQYNTIETITCLTKFAPNIHNLITLWGKHEALFNNLLLRYQMKLIPDLFEYFNQPWAYAIYHKNFPKMMDEIDMEFIMAQTDEGKKLVEEVKKMLIGNEWQSLSKLQNDEIEEMCKNSGFVGIIERKVLDFVHQHYQYLPMYVHQMLIRWILHQIQTSPLFVKTTFVVETDEEKTAFTASMPFFQRK